MFSLYINHRQSSELDTSKKTKRKTIPYYYPLIDTSVFDMSPFKFKCLHPRNQRTCCSTIILSIAAIILFLFSYIFFTKGTYHIQSSRYPSSQVLKCPNINQTRVEYGRKHFSQSRVIICGLIRDRRWHIERLKQQLNDLGKVFADYAIVIVENDSTDGTREELLHWEANDHHIHVVSCRNQTNNINSCILSLNATVRHGPDQSRIEKMVRLRNIYLSYIEKHVLLKQFDYVIVEDFDLTTYTYSDGLFSSAFHFQNDRTIDSICANGISSNQWFNGRITYDTYFDPYAHRDKQNEDWSVSYNDFWSGLFRRYSCQENLFPVQSCFSGRTIYRYKSIRGKRYRTYLGRDEQAVCEHVGFHQTLKRVFLNGEMIFLIIKNNN